MGKILKKDAVVVQRERAEQEKQQEIRRTQREVDNLVKEFMELFASGEQKEAEKLQSKIKGLREKKQKLGG